MKKRLMSLISAFATLILISATPFTAVADEAEIININGYDCYDIDGKHYTTINGQSCLVINLDEYTWHTDDAANSRAASPSWMNGSQIDISDGTRYNGSLDISTSDDSTPIFIGYYPDPYAPSSKLSYNIEADFVFANTYSVDVHKFDPNLNQWVTTNTPISFSLFAQHKIIFTGTTNSAPSKMCLTFQKEGITGESTIGYTFYVVNVS